MREDQYDAMRIKVEVGGVYCTTTINLRDFAPPLLGVKLDESYVSVLARATENMAAGLTRVLEYKLRHGHDQ